MWLRSLFSYEDGIAEGSERSSDSSNMFFIAADHLCVDLICCIAEIEARFWNDLGCHGFEHFLQLGGCKSVTRVDMRKGNRFSRKLLAADHPVESVFEAAGQGMHVLGDGKEETVYYSYLVSEVLGFFRQLVRQILIRRKMRKLRDIPVPADLNSNWCKLFNGFKKRKIGGVRPEAAADSEDLNSQKF
jgi:hypothetical protein